MSATTIIVNDVEPRRQYTATSGQTVFDFPIPFFSDEDLQVYLTPAGQQSSDTADLLTLITDYSVTGADTQDSGVITLVTGASTGDIITIERVVSIARTADYQTSGDLLAETVNREQDTEIFISQQLRAGINRSFRLPTTDTSAASLVLPSPTANYVIGWNSDGDAIINFQEIGQYQGTDATVTTVSYSVRDLVKSTTAGQLDNVYICTQASPSGTSLTNTSYWSLIVDAVSAATSETNAAASASAAATSASNASTSETNAATSETNAGNSATSASTSATNAANSASTASTAASNASTSETNAAASETNAGTSETNAASSASSASSSASTATTKASEAATSASNASTSATNAGTSETNAASSASSAATSESNASTSETNAASSASSAAASYDDFDDRYLGAKASDPTLDNDGDALITGALYFNTTDDVMKVWEGSSWVAAYASLSGALIASNNLSDLDSAPSALTNLGIANHDDITVDGSGNVGIGTSSPSTSLHISSAVPAVRLTDTDDNSDCQIAASASGFLVLDADINNEVSGSAMLFRVDGATERMRINSSGNVGIGTSSPSSKLEVNGTVTATSFSGDGSSLTGLPAGYTDSDALSLFNASGSAPVYACRAWVNFNGTGTVAIRASGNVSSITDNGTGDYTVNFTTAMPDGDYSVGIGRVGYSSSNSGNAGLVVAGSTGVGVPLQKTNSNLRLHSFANITAKDDLNTNLVQIFR